MTTPEALAREVKAELQRKGMTQRQLAERMRVPYRTVQRRLDGRTDLRLTDLEEMAQAIGVKSSELIARAEANKDSAA